MVQSIMWKQWTSWITSVLRKGRYFETLSLDDTKHEFCYFGFLLEGTGKSYYQIVLLHTTLMHTVFCSINIYKIFWGILWMKNLKSCGPFSRICYVESYHIITLKWYWTGREHCSVIYHTMRFVWKCVLYKHTQN